MTPPTFSAFITSTSSPSAAQSQTINGTDFNGDLTVTAPTHFEVSSDGSTWSTTATYTPDGSNVISGPLYVRLKTGSAADIYNENLTFTATNLNEKTTALNGTVKSYAINIDGEIDNGTVKANAYFANAGETIKLTITPTTCYQLKTLTVLDGNADNVDVNEDYQFTMPSSNVEIDAEFEMITYTISYSVNGTVINGLSESVNCGSDASLWDEDYVDTYATLPTGYTFAGWSTSASSTTTINELTPSESTTLYAVLAHTESGTPVTVYQKMTETTSDWSGDYLIVVESVNKVFKGTESSSYGECTDVEINTSSTPNYIENSETIEDYVVTVSSVTNGYTLKVKSGTYMNWTGKEFSLGETGVTYTIEYYADNDKSVKIIYNDGVWLQYNSSGGLRSYNSAQTKLQLYKKATITPTTTTYYTRVQTIPSGSSEIATVTPADLITVPSGAVLTITEACTGGPENLIIEDGGQLICNNSVQATVKKNITGHNTSKGDTDGWYFIATPVADGTTPSTSNGILNSTPANYDLYYYKEATHMWINYKSADGNADPGFTSDGGKLVNGKGYLYANASDAELSFEGATRAADATVTIPLSYTSDLTPSNLRGFNLVGNPFTYAFTSGEHIKIGNANLGTYYRIENGNQVKATTISNTNPINPNAGFMVYANAENTNLVFNPSSKGETASKPSFIQIEAGNNDYMDAAYIQFGNVNTLRKYTLNDATPQVYVINEGQDWASTVVNELTGEMPVHFKANADGQYTINVSTENVEMGYLHLIDTKTNADVDLMVTPSYSFNAKAGDNANRFRLVFKATSVDENENENENFAFVSNGTIIINGTGVVEMIDILGRVVSTKELSTINCQLSTPASPGVYLLRLTSDNKVRTQKMIIK